MLVAIIYADCTFVYKKATNISHNFLTKNNLCEITTQEQKFKKWFCTQKTGLNFPLKISNLKKNMSQKYLVIDRFIVKMNTKLK